MQPTVSWPGWEFIRKLGSGNYGAVYEIRQQIGPLERRAALKVIPVPRDENELEELFAQGYDRDTVERSLKEQARDVIQEFSVMLELKGHTNIVYGEDIRCVPRESGLGMDICIQMELLTPLLRAVEKGNEPMQAVRVGRDLLQALSVCQKKKIVHRDIKPQNIFVSDDGDFKLGDFGVARTMERTGSATMIGTLNYMAPEVYNGEHYGSASDIYSLGLVLYWLLNDRHLPFVPILDRPPKQSEVEQAAAQRFRGEEPPPPKNGSDPLKKLVCAMCAYMPQDRPDIRTLLEAFQMMLGQTVLQAERVMPDDKPEPEAPVPQENAAKHFPDEQETISVWHAVPAHSQQISEADLQAPPLMSSAAKQPEQKGKENGNRRAASHTAEDQREKFSWAYAGRDTAANVLRSASVQRKAFDPPQKKPSKPAVDQPKQEKPLQQLPEKADKYPTAEELKKKMQWAYMGNQKKPGKRR